MTRLFALLALSVLILGYNSQAFAASDVSECTVKTVKDTGDYENEYDFEFTKYPKVIVDLSKAGNKSVLIGAMSYSEAEESTIHYVYAHGSSAVEIAPVESDERFYVRVNFRNGTGEFQRLVNGTWVLVAELACK